MRIPKIWILLIHLLLASCTPSQTSESSTQALDLQLEATPTPTFSVPSRFTDPEFKAPKPKPSIDPIKVSGAVDLDGIEPALIAKKTKLKIDFKTQSSRNCNLTMKYLEISGLTNVSRQTQLNEALRQNMMDQMEAPNVMSAGDRCSRKRLSEIDKPYTRTVYCNVHFAAGSLVSLSCLNLSTPGAYPFPLIHTLTFDLKSGKIYRYADLFKPGSNYSVRMAVLMRDAWWEMGKGHASFPLDDLEAGRDFRFYLQERRDEAFRWGDARPFVSESPKICMIIPNLGSGASRNYLMAVRIDGAEDILNTNGALRVLVDTINNH